MILEAKCLKCGQIFNPHSETKEDLEHGVDDQGIPCGGAGELLGHWTQTGDSGLSVEALNAGIEACLAHVGDMIPGLFLCSCGERFPDVAVGTRWAAQNFLRHQMQHVADALAPHILAAIVERDGRREWRVTGDPGPQYSPYSFTWPRRGSNENGEEQARAFMAMFKKAGRASWADGPHLHHRTVYLHEGDWIPDIPQEPR